MGHTDDLEDFDAELEIALKKEYSAVFGLFTYCVITQEATYLCNKLRMECVPHSSYLLFDIRMDDVWVWDRNRPTRIIPRAQVYTTADVTVEQLKDGDPADFENAIPKDLLARVRAADSDDELIELGPAAASDALETPDDDGADADDTAPAADSPVEASTDATAPDAPGDETDP